MILEVAHAGDEKSLQPGLMIDDQIRPILPAPYSTLDYSKSVAKPSCKTQLAI
ncbi:hypothetical protein SNOG_09015 [Parastagonospora nodorum SN15]|uniref:Uncharacterized protein n=1 Tax=Phaeosphaeria nodorum (strain SN15 / ATCC MYA-4574 / FGSC 10173) TaxID=321614 RepID=Q0UGU9_PHANO|nr:hypothetical protein SNOG_09015 [Parastagonospora nodorum SN15]EAT83207.1 hypothetical protein SNOG_09015 [Parastagonospora nodorum SN15]